MPSAWMKRRTAGVILPAPASLSVRSPEGSRSRWARSGAVGRSDLSVFLDSIILAHFFGSKGSTSSKSPAFFATRMIKDRCHRLAVFSETYSRRAAPCTVWVRFQNTI